MATRILVLATKNEKLGASWPHDFFLKVEHWLVVVDYFSKYYEIEILFSTTSEKIIESLERIFMIHGLPLSVTKDNGLQFISSEFERYLEGCGNEHRKTTPLWPKANSEVERQN